MARIGRDGRGRVVIVVDASVLFELVSRGRHANDVDRRLSVDDELFAPHLIDAEVIGSIRAHHLRGRLDATAASQAWQDLRDWPGQRWAHGYFLERVWELRDNVRSWDAFYVALAEALDAPLLTLDVRLAMATGPRCRIDVVGA